MDVVNAAQQVTAEWLQASSQKNKGTELPWTSTRQSFGSEKTTRPGKAGSLGRLPRLNLRPLRKTIQSILPVERSSSQKTQSQGILTILSGVQKRSLLLTDRRFKNSLLEALTFCRKFHEYSRIEKIKFVCSRLTEAGRILAPCCSNSERSIVGHNFLTNLVERFRQLFQNSIKYFLTR